MGGTPRDKNYEAKILNSEGLHNIGPPEGKTGPQTAMKNSSSADSKKCPIDIAIELCGVGESLDGTPFTNTGWGKAAIVAGSSAATLLVMKGIQYFRS